MKIIFFCFFFSISFAYAQSTTNTSKYVSYENLIILRLNFDTNIENYILNDKAENIKEVLAINNKIKTSFGIDYQFLSASISFTPSFLPGNNQNDLKGKSSYTDIKFQFFPGRFLQQLRYKNVEGFYLENTQDFIENWQKGKQAYIQFPNYEVKTFGGSTSYFFNKNFSLKSLLFQREWQPFSSGSFAPSLDYDLTYFSGVESGVEKKERQINISTNLAYYYNFLVTPKFSLAPYLLAGIGAKNAKYTDKNPSLNTNNTFITYHFESGIQAEYNVKSFFYGAKMNYNSSIYNDQSSSVNNNNFYGLLFFGYRFAPPKSVKKTYEKIHKKIPIL